MLDLTGNTPIAPSLADTQPVKVCLAAQSFYPVYAGPAVRFCRYLPGFAARAVDVRVFTVTPNEKDESSTSVNSDWRSRRYGEMLPVETIHQTTVHRVRIPERGAARRSRWFGRELVEFCRQSSFRPDVLQLLSLQFWSVPALLRLRRLGIPTIFTKTMLAKLPRNQLKRALVRRYLALPLELVNCVVVSSTTMRQRLLGLGITTPIEVIANGVDIERFRPRTDAAERMGVRRSLGIGEDDTVLLFVGPVSPRKGVDLLLEAWCRLAPKYPRLRLVIVGPPHSATRPEYRPFQHRLEALLAASGASERVHFVGLVENVEAFMQAADLFVFTSRREGMPNVIPEAMACGLPVVTTPFIGLPSEFGEAGRHYVLANFDPARFAAAIETVLTDEGLAEELGRSARRWIEQEMAVERSLDRYADLYRRVAGLKSELTVSS